MTNIKTILKPQITLGFILVSLILLMSSAAFALTVGYQTKETLEPGTVVSLSEETDFVEPADLANTNRLVGVVVEDGTTLIAVTTEDSTVLVADRGIAKVLVNADEDIAKGDTIASSQYAGVATEAFDQTKILGIAQGGMDSSTIKTKTVRQANGDTTQIRAGLVEVDILVTENLQAAGRATLDAPEFLQSFAGSVAGKPVSTLRITLSTLIVIISLVVVTALLQGAMRAAVASIGRNPLAKNQIFKALIKITPYILGVLVLGLTAAYMVLVL